MAAQTQRPIKGILKNKSAESGSAVLAQAEHQPPHLCGEEDQNKKSQKWDEMNILATYHPSDKDYGLMKIDEPSTPYHKMMGDDDEEAWSDSESQEALTADALAQRLFAAEGTEPKFLAQEEESSEEEEEDLTPEEREKKKHFEIKRKFHYNEAMNIKLARQLIATEMVEEDDEDKDEEMQDIMDLEGYSEKLVADPPFHSVLPDTVSRMEADKVCVYEECIAGTIFVPQDSKQRHMDKYSSCLSLIHEKSEVQDDNGQMQSSETDL